MSKIQGCIIPKLHGGLLHTASSICSTVFFVGLLLVGAPIQAALQLRFDQPNLTDQQRRITLQLLNNAFDSLPPLMIEQLDRQVSVSWSDNLPSEVMGRATPRGKIKLNRRWLPALVAGHSEGLAPDRQHGTLQNELKATLLHELGHFYDQGRFWPAAERQLLQRCRSRHKAQGEIGLPRQCRGQTERRFTLSDAPRLLDLAGWPEQVGQRGQRETINRQLNRSVDIYELYSPQEFIAVNLEYFLLDPEYGCRRPALKTFFRQHFGWEPSHTADCASALPYMNASLDANQPALGWLDPARIYQVHYLLAEPDQTWASRWGHSMLRLVICAPGRPRSPDCMLDIEHHMVLSYRAFVDDVQLSSWDGLTGVYPSRLFILPLNQVLDEYTKTEMRSLSSVPLNMTREEQIGLATQATSQHWSYDGNYYFVSNNCAVETLKLLRSGSDHHQLRYLDSYTPTGLLQILEARGLANYAPLINRDEALRQGYYFASYRNRYEQMFAVVRANLNVPQKSIDDWLALSADQRQAWLPQANQRAAAALLLLEQAALRQHIHVIQHDLKKRYLADDGTNDGLSEAGRLMQELITDSSFLSRPADLLSDGYGIPQAAERDLLENSARQRHSSLLTTADQLDNRLRAMLSVKQQQELDGTQHNIELLSGHLRQLHREAGGLVLP